MTHSIIQSLGNFFYPQLIVSIMTVAIVAGYGVAFVRGELDPVSQPWRRTLKPLSSLAISLGLAGTVWSFIGAFSGFRNGIDVSRIGSSLALGYATTMVGVATSIIASLGCYFLGLVRVNA